MTKAPTDASGVPRQTLLAYSLPAFVVALPTIPVMVFLPPLYASSLGLGLILTGYILLIGRIFDTATDPLVGWLSDRHPIGGARRKPWIAIGAVLAGVGLVRILNPPTEASAGYLLGWSIVLYGGWTMVAVPYLTWGAELTKSYDERSRITSWREGAALIGIVAAGIVNAVAVQVGWSETASVGAIAWLAVAIGAVLFPLLIWLVPEAEIPRTRPTRAAQTSHWRTLFANRLFQRLLSTWFLNSLANGIPAALFFYYLEYGLGASAGARPIFILVYFVSAILGIPLWLSLSRRWSKHKIWCVAMLAAALAFIMVPVLSVGAYAAFAAVCLITGLALGADLALPPAMQADVVDYDRLKFGTDRAGQLFALWSMSTKLALAAAFGVALPGVAVLGFDPAAPSEAGRTALVVIYAVVPCVIKVLAVVIIWRFPLTRQKHSIIVRRLENNRGSRLSKPIPAYGNALNRQYDMNLKTGENLLRFRFNDWMYLQAFGVLLNRTHFSKLGLEVGAVTLVVGKTANVLADAAPALTTWPDGALARQAASR